MLDGEANEVVLRREGDGGAGGEHLTGVGRKEAVRSVAELVVERLQFSLTEERGVHEDLKVPLLDQLLHFVRDSFPIGLQLVSERTQLRTADLEEAVRIKAPLRDHFKRLEGLIVCACLEEHGLVELQNRQTHLEKRIPACGIVSKPPSLFDNGLCMEMSLQGSLPCWRKTSMKRMHVSVGSTPVDFVTREK